MKTSMTCEQYREALVDETAGLLDPADRVAVEEHRAACQTCAAETVRDAWLREALRALPSETPPETSWQRVLAERRPARVRARLLRLSLAGAATFAVLAAFLFMHPFQHQISPDQIATTTPPTAASVASETARFTGAHSMVSASDMTGDPNRDVILIYGAPPDSKGGS